jgi:hypothetical protein
VTARRGLENPGQKVIVVAKRSRFLECTTD